MKKLFPLAIILVLLCCTGRQGQETVPHAMSRGLDSLFQTAVCHGEIPSAVALVWKSGEEVYHESFGYRILEIRDPLAKDDIFRMASMTKGLTAVAILQLEERGLLELDDPVSEYLPEFAGARVITEIHEDSSWSSRPATGLIRISHLLTHTSGIGYGFQDERYNMLVTKQGVSEGFEDDDRSSRDNIRRIGGLPLLADPGETYIYSLSYDVLGVLIEEVSGLRYDHYIRENILEPLAMDDSYFIIPGPERHRLVKAYEPSPRGLVPTTYPDTAYPVLEHRRYFSGGADLCSSARDYSRFIRMLMNGGSLEGQVVLGEEQVRKMLSRQSSLGEGNSYQGYGTWIVNGEGALKGPRSRGSFDFGGFWDTYSWADPEKEMVAVLLLQMYPGNEHDIHQKFQEIIYRHIDD